MRSIGQALTGKVTELKPEVADHILECSRAVVVHDLTSRGLVRSEAIPASLRDAPTFMELLTVVNALAEHHSDSETLQRFLDDVNAYKKTLDRPDNRVLVHTLTNDAREGLARVRIAPLVEIGYQFVRPGELSFLLEQRAPTLIGELGSFFVSFSKQLVDIGIYHTVPEVQFNELVERCRQFA